MQSDDICFSKLLVFDPKSMKFLLQIEIKENVDFITLLLSHNLFVLIPKHMLWRCLVNLELLVSVIYIFAFEYQ